jgi:hypothetical protein
MRSDHRALHHDLSTTEVTEDTEDTEDKPVRFLIRVLRVLCGGELELPQSFDRFL